VLSGGERNRLALAILLLRPANLLLLDEPTNHLDLASKEVLLEALQAYQGTLVFVSHDRYFVDALASRVVEVAAGTATAYLGNYEDFLRAKGGGGGHSTLRVESAAVARSEAGGDKAARLASHAERKAVQREAQRREKRLFEVEARIAELEAQLADLTGQMQDPAMAVDHARLYPLIDQHAVLQAELDELLRCWEELHEPAGEAG
jgi:ATP-binding cassette subfamily F protein 3